MKIKGDPTPVCRFCREYTPDWGTYVDAVEDWICYHCLPTAAPPSNRALRDAIEAIRMVV